MTLWGALLKQVKRLAGGLQEQPTADIEDIELEHFMLYHGLVGSSPDNQRQFRDVRADIQQAVHHRSSVEMAICFKLPPLWWEDKFAAIFSELKDQEEALRQCLLPVGQDVPEADPLRHPDWRVRANASRVLAILNFTDAQERMAQSLDESADSAKPAFCHIAYALGSLRGEVAKQALKKHLLSDEPWFRVDAAGALAMYPWQETFPIIAEALPQRHRLTDYECVAVARKQALAELLTTNDALLQEGAVELCIGCIEASRGPFGNQIISELELSRCLPLLIELARSSPSPRRIRAALLLCSELPCNRNELIEKLGHEAIKNCTIEQLKKADTATANDSSQIFHAINLAAETELKDAAPHLIPLLKPQSKWVNELMHASSVLGLSEAAPAIVNVIEKSVNLQERSEQAKSKQPVFEDEPEMARTYWSALKALGSLPDEVSIACLIKATRDFAPDKRQQALESLIKALKGSPSLLDKHRKEVHEVVARGLDDANVNVKSAALTGVSAFSFVDLIPSVVRAAGAKEATLFKHSCEVMSELARQGHQDAVKSCVRSKIASEINQNNRQRLQDFVETI